MEYNVFQSGWYSLNSMMPASAAGTREMLSWLEYLSDIYGLKWNVRTSLPRLGNYSRQPVQEAKWFHGVQTSQS